eukprot:TRINITY_DN4924_c0_g1_i3.p1 TRINITY_DN4924_c0_g1~~TRINITY_DN4924_c0_g1_i3.p1  ORF type:complete len:326 (+),score=49.41 TRINITY_DN4924_c0_g1_i3:61-978(+)
MCIRDRRRVHGDIVMSPKSQRSPSILPSLSVTARGLDREGPSHRSHQKSVVFYNQYSNSPERSTSTYLLPVKSFYKNKNFSLTASKLKDMRSKKMKFAGPEYRSFFALYPLEDIDFHYHPLKYQGGQNYPGGGGAGNRSLSISEIKLEDVYSDLMQKNAYIKRDMQAYYQKIIKVDLHERAAKLNVTFKKYEHSQVMHKSTCFTSDTRETKPNPTYFGTISEGSHSLVDDTKPVQRNPYFVMKGNQICSVIKAHKSLQLEDGKNLTLRSYNSSLILDSCNSLESTSKRRGNGRESLQLHLSLIHI